MKLNTQSPLVVLCLFFTIITLFSCSKDSDLMAEYVALDPDVLIGKYVRNDTFQVSISNNSEDETFEIIVNSDGGGTENGTSGGTIDDTYQTSTSASIMLNVLANDTFTNKEEVEISETSQPDNGEVVINSDNTLTFTPSSVEVSENTFTYTAEFFKEDGTVGKETGTVTVTINEGSNKMGELKAFPGAEGFGKVATGGRGGIVVEVTNLNDSGSGSLREALKMTQTRTIVFRVGGIIECNSYLEIPEESGNVTIAGQTAPGDGILIKNGELRVSASNVIIRYMRFRLGTNVSDSNLDALKFKSFNSTPLRNVIVDHCSVSWGQDENISITNAENVTIQNTIIGECVKNVLIQKSKDVSFLNNVTCLTTERNIRANTTPHLDLTFEMINNLIYGFNAATLPSEGLKFTIENNIYIHSNDFNTDQSNIVSLVKPNSGNLETNTIENTYAYIKGNVIPSNTVPYSDKTAPFLEDSPLYRSTYSPISTTGLKEALLENAGAFPRDDVDKRYINNIVNKTGTLASNGTYPNISGGTAYTDDDHDGMDDGWEYTNGLNSDDPEDGKKDRNGNGYSNLEEFLHYLAIK